MAIMKTISVEIKRSKNYQTYSVGLSADLQEGDDEMIETRKLQSKARLLVKEQVDLG